MEPLTILCWKCESALAKVATDHRGYSQRFEVIHFDKNDHAVRVRSAFQEL